VGGVVIDAESGAPIGGVLVTLSLRSQLDRSNPVAPWQQSATSDDKGQFHFENVPSGNFQTNALGRGWDISGFGKLRFNGQTILLSLEPGERVDRMMVRMWHNGRIAGHVTDSEGKPIVGATIDVARRSPINGGEYSTSFALISTTTDERGEFHLESLGAAHYRLAVRVPGVTTPLSVEEAVHRENSTNLGTRVSDAIVASRGPLPTGRGSVVDSLRYQVGLGRAQGPMPFPPLADGTVVTYAGDFAPAGTPTGPVADIDLKPGEQRSDVDFKVHVVRTVRVSGQVTGLDESIPAVAVQFIPIAAAPGTVQPRATDVAAAVAITDSSGHFTALGVPPGRYAVRAMVAPLWTPPPPASPNLVALPPRPGPVKFFGQIEITVDQTVTNVALSLRRTAVVSGQIQFEGARPPSTTERAAVRASLWASPSPGFFLPLPVGIASDGSFRLEGYTPGRYYLSIYESAWDIKSIVIDGHTPDEPRLVLGAADVAVRVVMTRSEDQGRIAATVEIPPSLAGRDITVALFPVDYADRYTDGLSTSRTRFERASKTSRVQIGFLPSGQYFIVAYREADGDEPSQAFLDRLARVASRVTIGEGPVEELQLRVTDIK
jgi:hypothetical protein